MRRRWRYGLAVDLTAWVWAVGMFAVTMLALSGAARAGFTLRALAEYGALGVVGGIAVTFVSWQTVRMVREGSADGDVRRPDQG